MGLFSILRKNAPQSHATPLDDAPLTLDAIGGAVVAIDGFPRIEWTCVHRAVNELHETHSLDRIWNQLAIQWLGILQQHLGARYQIYEGEHLLLLSSQSPIQANELLRMGDAGYRRLEQLLDRPAASRGYGKHAVLALRNDRAYYDYISYYYRDRTETYATSAGCLIKKGFRHTVLNSAGDSSRILLHEMAHNVVFDRALPLWIEEGLAQFAEDLVPGYRSPLIDHRQARLQRRYWTWFGIDRFWSGASFSSPASQRLSYQLADILFRNLVSDRTRRKKLRNFLAKAHRRDAGLAACQESFGCTLATLAAEFLGDGEWEPISPTNSPPAK